MHFIDFDAMQAKEEPDFDAAIKVCDKFELSTLCPLNMTGIEIYLPSFMLPTSGTEIMMKCIG